MPYNYLNFRQFTMQSSSLVDHRITTIHPKVKYTKIQKNLKSRRCCVIISGSVAIILGLNLIILQGSIMNFISEKILNLSLDSKVFKLWQKYPLEVPNSFTFFNWTNHEDFFNRSVKPNFKEIGPYILLQGTERVDVVQNYNNDTITFKQVRNYYYDKNSPNNGNFSDQLTTFNYLTMFAGHLIEDWSNTAKDVFSETVSLFDPHYYFHTIVDNELLKGGNSALIELSNYFDFILPDFPRVDGFGWAKMRSGNADFEGVYNIGNGVNRQFDVLNWNYQSATSSYNDSCGEVKGSIGDIYSFPLNKEYITVFAPEVCRFLKLYFEEEVVVDGIMGYKYSVTKLSLDNGSSNPENKCFCEESCLPSGLMGISTCQQHLNIYFSLPHFYNADPIYLDYFEGLNPQKHYHEAYIVVEPNSLLCLQFKIAIQFNVLVYPVEDISVFEDYPKLYFPLLWLDAKGELPNDMKTYLKLYLSIPYGIVTTAVILIILGLSSITSVAVHQLIRLCSLRKSRSVNQNVEISPLNRK